MLCGDLKWEGNPKNEGICVSLIPRLCSGEESTCNAGDAGDMGMILGLGRSPGEGNCSPRQYSCWRIPWTEEPGKPVHGVTELDMAEHSTLELRASGDWCWKWLQIGPWESMEGGKHLLGWKEESTIVPPQNGPGSSHSTYTESSPSTGFLSISVPISLPISLFFKCEKRGQSWCCWARKGIIFPQSVWVWRRQRVP